MHLDHRRLDDLIVESEDLQSQARREARESLPLLVEYAHDQPDRNPSPLERARFDQSRRQLLRNLGLGGAGIAVAGTGLGGLLSSIVASPAAADKALDVQILQTASSLEKLAVATYAAALTLPFISGGNQVVVKFAQTTMMQHDEHKKAFQAQTTSLGGTAQDTPNPKYAPIVEQAKPTLKTPADVVKLAMTLETVARDTYLSDLSMFSDATARNLMATVMGVETQHLATLRAVAALLAAPGGAALIAIPTDIAKLPAAAGSVGFPDAIPQPKLASPPAEGATK